MKKVYHASGHIATIKELLRLHKKYENKDCWMWDSGYAFWYMNLQDYDKALDYYEKWYENNNHNPDLPYISSKRFYNKLKDNPRYIALLKKMNLPVD